jgi:hypothetical protein
MTTRLPSDAEPFERPLFEAARGMVCVPPELLLPHAAGTLPEPLSARVSEFLEACPVCRNLAAALSEIETAPTPDEERRVLQAVNRARFLRPWRSAWLTAAAAVLVAAVGAMLVVNRPIDNVPPARSPARDLALPAQSYALALEKPPVDLPPDALVLRGSTSEPYVAALASALQPWRANRFEEAARRFLGMTKKFPDRARGHYYLGASLLMDGRAADAVGPLDRARTLATDRTLRDSATWYLAVAFERSGRAALAVQELAAICRGDGARRADACRGLERLRPPLGSNGQGRSSGRAAVGVGDRPSLDPAPSGTAVPVR